MQPEWGDLLRETNRRLGTPQGPTQADKAAAAAAADAADAATAQRSDQVQINIIDAASDCPVVNTSATAAAADDDEEEEDDALAASSIRQIYCAVIESPTDPLISVVFFSFSPPSDCSVFFIIYSIRRIC